MDTQAFHIQLVFQIIKTLLHGIFVPVNPERFHGIFDIVSQEHIKAGITVTVLLDGFVVKDHFSAPYRCFFNGKECFVSIFVIAESLAAFQFFFVGQQFFSKAIGGSCCRMSIVVQVHITAPTLFPPGIQLCVDIEDLIIQLTVAFRILNGIPNFINNLLDPLSGGNRNREFLPCHQQFIHVLLAVKTPIHHQAQLREVKVAEGLQNIVQRSDISDITR